MGKENPFRGPNSYEEGDNFFGRDKEIKEVSNLIRNENLTLLFSRSGTGKSSLIKAGLIPVLRKNFEYLPVYIHLFDSSVNSNSTNSLSNYVIRRCKEEIKKHLEGLEKVKVHFAKLENENSLFEFIVTTKLTIVESPDNEYVIKLIIIFDQFEEIFTHAFDQSELQFLISEVKCLVESELPQYLNNSESKNFIEIRNSLISKQKNFRILFSFREEYLPQFESLTNEIPFIRFTNSRFRLEAFFPEAAEDVIVKTDAKIAEFIAHQITVNLEISILTNFNKVIVEPFLLSLVCQKVYLDIIDQTGIGDEVIKKIKDLVDNSINRYIDEIYEKIGEETKAFIETRLITSDHKRTPYNYDEAISTFSIGDDINLLVNDPRYRLLNKEQFLDSSHLEILHDRLLPPLANRRVARIKKAEDDALKIKQEQLEKDSDKKRNRLIAAIAGCSFILILILASFYLINVKQKTALEQMAMFYKANQFLDGNDLQKAYGIYSRLDIKKYKFISEQIDRSSKNLTYSDLPGESNIVLSDSHIIAELDSATTFEIWEVVSPTSVKYCKTYQNIKLHAVGLNKKHMAIYANNKLIVYDSKKNSDTVLIKGNSESIDDIYFSFSTNNQYLFYYSKSQSFVFDLNNNMKKIRINEHLDYPHDLKNILFISDTIIYSQISAFGGANYLAKWKRKDTLTIDSAHLLKDSTTPWCYLRNDSVILITTNGLELKNLSTGRQTILLKGNYQKFNGLRKISDNRLLLYFNKDKAATDKYSAIGFYTLGHNAIYEPLQGNVFDKVSVSLNWAKCLIRSDNDNVYLVDNIKNSSKIFSKDTIYDISDDGKYVLYAKEKNYVRKRTNTSSYYDKMDTIGILYLRSLYGGNDLMIDTLDIYSARKNNKGIYGKYSFHFNSNSTMFVYINKNKDDSSRLIVRNIKDNKIIYQSTVPQNFNNGHTYNDFTSAYINIKNLNSSNEDRNGIKLLNNRERKSAYFFDLYRETNLKVWDDEFKKASMKFQR